MENGVVYFIQRRGGGLVKIGKTKNIRARFRDLQRNSPAKLILLGTYEGYSTLERELHQRFEKYRVRGEWFVPADCLIEIAPRNGFRPPREAPIYAHYEECTNEHEPELRELAEDYVDRLVRRGSSELLRKLTKPATFFVEPFAMDNISPAQLEMLVAFGAEPQHWTQERWLEENRLVGDESGEATAALRWAIKMAKGLVYEWFRAPMNNRIKHEMLDAIVGAGPILQKRRDTIWDRLAP